MFTSELSLRYQSRVVPGGPQQECSGWRGPTVAPRAKPSSTKSAGVEPFPADTTKVVSTSAITVRHGPTRPDFVAWWPDLGFRSNFRTTSGHLLDTASELTMFARGTFPGRVASNRSATLGQISIVSIGLYGTACMTALTAPCVERFSRHGTSTQLAFVPRISPAPRGPNA